MATPQDNPMIVQSDNTILMEVNHPRYHEARDAIATFAELIKSPEHVHTYKITALSIWNARAAGHEEAEIIENLTCFSKFDIPDTVLANIRDFANRYGLIRLKKQEEKLLLEILREDLYLIISNNKSIAPFLNKKHGDNAFIIDPENRGKIKLALIALEFPVEDIAGFTPGKHLGIELRKTSRAGGNFHLRPYQQESRDVFYAGGKSSGGSGVIVLPCGAGKTIVGIGCITAFQCYTLILTTGGTSVRQWREEILDKTNLNEADIGEYTSSQKEIKPITVTTYQMLTHRATKTSPFTHMSLFNEEDWGLIIYDEVHLLPAPVFQVTAGLQARRRLGLTATLIREDEREGEVFALVGPKKYDIPWKLMEQQGWIAKAQCTEIRIPLPASLQMEYAIANKRTKFRIAAENLEKRAIVKQLTEKHKGSPILIIGMYIDQIRAIAESLGIPLLSGSTSQKKREALFQAFRNKEISVLAVSKVANFAVDLPDAAVAIQVSGTFGSRQEEAQRLGRILRPKKGENQAHFYSLISQDTVEQDYALNRQLFLCEQGYSYNIQYHTP